MALQILMSFPNHNTSSNVGMPFNLEKEITKEANINRENYDSELKWLVDKFQSCLEKKCDFKESINHHYMVLFKCNCDVSEWMNRYDYFRQGAIENFIHIIKSKGYLVTYEFKHESEQILDDPNDDTRGCTFNANHHGMFRCRMWKELKIKIN